jgi:hypothetical protein
MPWVTLSSMSVRRLSACMFPGSFCSSSSARASAAARNARGGRTVELAGLGVVAHLVVAEREVVEALAPARGLGAVERLEEAHALDVLRARGRLDEPPGVVELRLRGEVLLRELALVLRAQDLL